MKGSDLFVCNYRFQKFVTIYDCTGYFLLHNSHGNPLLFPGKHVMNLMRKSNVNYNERKTVTPDALANSVSTHMLGLILFTQTHCLKGS